jgi:hypothetical protein
VTGWPQRRRFRPRVHAFADRGRELLKKTFSDYGSNGESATMRVYAAKAVTDYDAQIMQARTVAGSL